MAKPVTTKPVRAKFVLPTLFSALAESAENDANPPLGPQTAGRRAAMLMVALGLQNVRA